MSDFTRATMDRISARFAETGMSLDDFGQRMGYPKLTARKSAWQFLNGTNDPRLSMIEKAAAALGVSVSELLDGRADDDRNLVAKE